MKFTDEEKAMMQEACLRAINEIKKRALSENAIEEYGGSDILYHFTSLPALLSILLNDGKHGGYFQYGIPDGTEDKLINTKMAGGNKEPYKYYMSLTRSHNVNWGYTKAINNTSFGKRDREGNENTYNSKIDKIPLSKVGTVRLTFDGKELTKGRVIKAIDFFGAGNAPEGGHEGRTLKTRSGKWAGSKNQDLRYSQVKQQEDRIFSNDYNFDGILNFVTRVDVLISNNPRGMAWANKIIAASKGTPVEGKIHIYNDIKAYNRVDYSRLKNTLEKSGLGEKDWRPEITDKIAGDYRFSDRDYITNSNAKLIAVFVWALLFYRFSRIVNESRFEWKLTNNFTDEEVIGCLKHFTKTIKDENLKKTVEDKVLKQFRNITNEELIDFLTGTKNYKLTSAVGLARTVLGPIKETIINTFNVSSIKEALHIVGNIFANYYKGYAEIIDSKKRKQEKQKKYAAKQKEKGSSPLVNK